MAVQSKLSDEYSTNYKIYIYISIMIMMIKHEYGYYDNVSVQLQFHDINWVQIRFHVLRKKLQDIIDNYLLYYK